MLTIDSQKTSQKLKKFIKDYLVKLERDGIVFGLSGGLDSAVVASLCVKAVGADKVMALIMPDNDSQKQHLKDALKLAKQLKIKIKLINITPYLKSLGTWGLSPLNRLPIPRSLKEKLVKKAFAYYQRKTGINPFADSLLGFKDKKFASWLQKGNAYYRIKHRLRMVLLYLWAERENRLVVGAANKTEAKIGFFVKHGCDDAADIMPIVDLYKTQVRQLAQYLKIPQEIITKAPSPDIIPGVVDEQAIGMSYEILDQVLDSLETGLKTKQVAQKLNLQEKEVEKVKRLMKRSEHMRQVYSPV
ncbi:NAD(+) synthase [Candidatus Shapirobacteria bacterium]|nr:NAD(+) synthase [Candidatus Shapirobacteria bacterium]